MCYLLAGEGTVQVGGHVVLEVEEAAGEVELAGLACTMKARATKFQEGKTKKVSVKASSSPGYVILCRVFVNPVPPPTLIPDPPNLSI